MDNVPTKKRTLSILFLKVKSKYLNKKDRKILS